MEITKTAVAGTVESSDIMITVSPNEEKKIVINLDSSVEKQYGVQIRELIKKTLDNLGIKSVTVDAIDKGALDCTIQARTITAVNRALDVKKYNWKEIDTWNV
ncbi:citrate lyase acyl carrier protein [Helcococcus ovis]|uniref:Citrate lyase acyl carrier protein n=3 Tax=Bacteria TaxID=2 RepID=A0A4R9C4X3_9FIRM|nr:citrate lyase acyl carrier protein [Helcococcus ovis]TFF65336.1 citrate lyase acyl carrier protein [Helcococcus ovis]TFF65990.1 citrate lyase acyl carrier protein [Helcococcus ovis]TFF67707.1 citrate lyase acyl carrier protein [Helcococcus ovis]WNZ01262.1 citrate lyase acyl carrier protein [Helcococcus ovis]